MIEHNWTLNHSGSTREARAVNGKVGYLHRFVMKAPTGTAVDHVRHDALDNRKKMMRLCTTGENNLNSRRRRGTSKYKGVSWAKHLGKWYAQAGKRGKKKNLGLYDSEIDAALAYNRYAAEHYGEFANLNQV